MVSIIVPVYNVESYLDKCITSIVNQTFKDIEIILIDDGSTDKSGEICLKWQSIDKRIIYIKKENEGQGMARNAGIKVCKGDYITFVDSDDWIEEDAVEIMYNAEKESNADIIVSDMNYVLKDTDGNLKASVSKLRIEENKLLYSSENVKLIDVARPSIWGKLYKRDFYMNSKIEQPNHAYEDFSVVPFLIAKAETIYYVPKPLYNYYRSRPDSTVNNFEYIKDLNKSLIEIRDRFKEEGLFEKYYKALMKISYAQVRFVYRKLLRGRKEIENKHLSIIEDLYKIMDTLYPEWVNTNKYTVGVSGEKNLRKAVSNTVLNDYRVETNNERYLNLIDKDILIIELVNDLFYRDIEAWRHESIENLKNLENNFKGEKVIAVKFICDDYSSIDKAIVDDIYNYYLKSNLNIGLIELKGNRHKYNESLTWDLSDEILKKLVEEYNR